MKDYAIKVYQVVETWDEWDVRDNYRDIIELSPEQLANMITMPSNITPNANEVAAKLCELAAIESPYGIDLVSTKVDLDSELLDIINDDIEYCDVAYRETATEEYRNDNTDITEYSKVGYIVMIARETK